MQIRKIPETEEKDFGQILKQTLDETQKGNISFLDISMFHNFLSGKELSEKLDTTLGNFFSIKHIYSKTENKETIKVVGTKEYEKRFKEFEDNHIWEGFEIEIETKSNDFFEYQIINFKLPQKLTKKVKDYLLVLSSILKDKYDFNTNILGGEKNFTLLDDKKKLDELDFLAPDLKSQEKNQQMINKLQDIIKYLNNNIVLSENDKKILKSLGISDHNNIPFLLKRLEDKIFDLDIGVDLQRYMHLSNLIENKFISIQEDNQNKEQEKEQLEKIKQEILSYIQTAQSEQEKNFLQKELISIENQSKHFLVKTDNTHFNNAIVNIWQQELETLEQKLQTKIENYKKYKTGIETLEKIEQLEIVKPKKESFFTKIFKPITQARKDLNENLEPKEKEDFFYEMLFRFINENFLDIYNEQSFKTQNIQKAKEQFQNKVNLLNDSDFNLSTLKNGKYNMVYVWGEIDYEELEIFYKLFQKESFHNYDEVKNYVKQQNNKYNENFQIVALSQNEYILLGKNIYLFLEKGNEYKLYISEKEIHGGVKLKDHIFYNVVEENGDYAVKYLKNDGTFEYLKIDENYFTQLGEYEYNDNDEIVGERIYEEFNGHKLVIGYIHDEAQNKEKRVLLKESSFQNKNPSYIKTENYNIVSKVLKIAKVGRFSKTTYFEIELINGQTMYAQFDGDRFYDVKTTLAIY